MSDATRSSNTVPPALQALMAFLGIAMVLALFYLHYPHEMLSVFLAWRHAELWFIGLFTDRYFSLDDAVTHPDWNLVGITSVLALGSIVGRIYNVLAATVLLALAPVVYFYAPARRYKGRIKDLDELILAMHPRFGASRAFVGRKRKLRRPSAGQKPKPGDVSLHPHEWIAAFARDTNGTYHEDLARCAFEVQLGPVWRGSREAADHVRCLFAAFALHASRQRERAIYFLAEIAQSLPPGNGDVALSLPRSIVQQADDILQDPNLIAPCAAVAGRHHYTTTAMMGVLCFARDRAGVLAPNQYNWLKLVDRALWYALLMTPNPYIEAAGAHAHFMAEREARSPLTVPHIEPALKATRAQRHDAPSTVIGDEHA